MASRSLIQSNVDGLEAARRALERVLRAEGAGARDALPLIGQEAVRRIRLHAPLATGRLRRSYAYEVGDGYVDVGSAVEYAPYQEFGTRFMDGQPHFRPALEEMRDVIPDLVAKAAERAGRSAAGGGGVLGNIVRRVVGGLG